MLYCRLPVVTCPAALVGCLFLCVSHHVLRILAVTTVISMHFDSKNSRLKAFQGEGRPGASADGCQCGSRGGRIHTQWGCREVLYEERPDGETEVTGLRLTRAGKEHIARADAYVAALDVPGQHPASLCDDHVHLAARPLHCPELWLAAVTWHARGVLPVFSDG